MLLQLPAPVILRRREPCGSGFPFFFNDAATTAIYTLSLHDALPIWQLTWALLTRWSSPKGAASWSQSLRLSPDRKSTRLNSSHRCISYAVFCLKKKSKCGTVLRRILKPTDHHVAMRENNNIRRTKHQ